MNSKIKRALLLNGIYVLLIGIYYIKGDLIGAILFLGVFMGSLLFDMLKPPGEQWWLRPQGRTMTQEIVLWLDTVMALVASLYVLYSFWIHIQSIWIILFMTIPFFVGIFFFFFSHGPSYFVRRMIWHVGGAFTILSFILIW